MYGTIEPRLIALLNEEPLPIQSSAPPASPFDLPPLQDANLLKTPSRLPPLGSNGTSQSNNDKVAQSSLKGAVPNHDLLPKVRDTLSNLPEAGSSIDRARKSTASESLRKILDDDPDPVQPATSKRQVIDSGKEDFVQLPQPPKKQKTVQQVVPPIIIGLFEPPPNAALFPPIAASSFHDSRGRNTLNVAPLQESVNKAPKVIPVDAIKTTSDKKLPAKRASASKRRRKWDDDETNHLLLGVHKHGVGRWTKILQDPEFKFNDRKPVDLKDRFRTCCPDELRGKKSSTLTTVETGPAKSKQRSSLLTENILIDDEFSFFDESSNSDVSGDETSEKPRKSRAHRKKIEDLAELGIDAPFKRSSRRQRRAFTEQEDRSILLGYEKYGPAWTLIQRDPTLGLQSRRPTDIRDRLRNKDPVKFRKIRGFRKDHVGDEGTVVESQAAVKFASSAAGINLPSNSEALSTSSKPHTSQTSLDITSIVVPTTAESNSMSKTIAPAAPTSSASTGLTFAFRDILSDFPDASVSADSSDHLALSQSLDWNTSFTSSIADMDISRLLLEDTWPSSLPGGNTTSSTTSTALTTPTTMPTGLLSFSSNFNGGVTTTYHSNSSHNTLPHGGSSHKRSFTDIQSIIDTTSKPPASFLFAASDPVQGMSLPLPPFSALDGDAGLS